MATNEENIATKERQFKPYEPTDFELNRLKWLDDEVTVTTYSVRRDADKMLIKDADGKLAKSVVSKTSLSVRDYLKHFEHFDIGAHLQAYPFKSEYAALLKGEMLPHAGRIFSGRRGMMDGFAVVRLDHDASYSGKPISVTSDVRPDDTVVEISGLNVPRFSANMMRVKEWAGKENGIPKEFERFPIDLGETMQVPGMFGFKGEYFSDADKENLAKTGGLGRVALAMNKYGEVRESLVSIDDRIVEPKERLVAVPVSTVRSELFPAFQCEGKDGKSVMLVSQGNRLNPESGVPELMLKAYDTVALRGELKRVRESGNPGVNYSDILKTMSPLKNAAAPDGAKDGNVLFLAPIPFDGKVSFLVEGAGTVELNQMALEYLSSSIALKSGERQVVTYPTAIQLEALASGRGVYVGRPDGLSFNRFKADGQWCFKKVEEKEDNAQRVQYNTVDRKVEWPHKVEMINSKAKAQSEAQAKAEDKSQQLTVGLHA